ncbi:MAG: phenylalanine--tRNA ligase subunit alpha [Candidatus Hydrogenedentota bacterium]|nr:MAG: phenylalanine--tRNA ligase subunit alpha [Candidatus Hydrogenedentota bacterium]
MEDEVQAILEQARSALAEPGADKNLLRARFLGKKSRLKILMKGLKDLPSDQRPSAGAALQKLRAELEELFSRERGLPSDGKKAESKKEASRKTRISRATLETILDDWSRPGIARRIGYDHPLRRTTEEIISIFRALGFGVAEGPDIEDDRHNFTDLNFPPDHPARDTQDTFFIDPPDSENPLLLRTHTSPVQIRVMEHRVPPLAVVVPGRTYRSDAADATHSPIFHQVEGLFVDTGVTFAHLKGTLGYFVQGFFGPEYRTRFRPSFFPFTEPSAEVDVSCVVCGGTGRLGGGSEGETCRICKGTGYLEILGAGMVDPEVFEAVCRRRGDRIFDPEKVTGFAFGMGVERLAMLKHSIEDMRLFFENDPRFLEIFS